MLELYFHNLEDILSIELYSVAVLLKEIKSSKEIESGSTVSFIEF